MGTVTVVTERSTVEDRDQTKPDEQDVEAHRKKVRLANEEGEAGSDDFELHKRRSAADEGGESGDDDVELHRRTKLSK